MLSEPLDSSSSDTKSFDEEDMYRSGSEIETVSLPSGSNQVQQSLEHTVCASSHDICSSIVLHKTIERATISREQKGVTIVRTITGQDKRVY
jgi:hypothetical protein